MKYMGERETYQSVAIVIEYIYYAFRQMFVQAKKRLVEQSFSLCSFYFSYLGSSLLLFHSCVYNWWAKAQILNIQHDDSWKEKSVYEKKENEKTNVVLFVQ